jgi:magnesium chelatase family protein
VALLVASYQLEPETVQGSAVIGELSLTGEVRAVHGALAVAEGVRRAGLSRIVLPRSRAREAALVPDIEVVGVESLQQLVATMRGDAEPQPMPDSPPEDDEEVADLSDVRGQNGLIPGLEVAAAGGHNLFLQGPPGTGKTMIARRLPSILPMLSPDEALEVTRIQSVAGMRGDGVGLVTARPFRAPHHTISAAGLVGGASPPQPGEATLAHRGVLFLDELSEFARPALEALRQPLEDGQVTIVRGQQVMVFPTRFMLVAASNPCPCGYGDARCKCTQGELMRHRRRLSGPLLDRIDILMRVERAPARQLRQQTAPASASVRERVVAARERQTHRLAGEPETCNAQLTSQQIRQVCRVTADAMHVLGDLYDQHTLSARGHTRILRVARTVADLDGSDVVTPDHVSVAASLRFDDANQLAEAA